MIRGIKFEFKNLDKQKTCPKPIHMSKEETEFMDRKIEELLQDGSIKRVAQPHPEGWLSNMFLVPKKDGGFRMILNLKPLNKFIKYQKFKMDHIEQVLQLIKQDSVLCSLDISSAFSHLYLLPEHQKYVCFEWKGKFYEYQCLPQGATCSPRLFVRVTTPIMKYLRRRMVTIVIYIDDTLLVARSVGEMHANLQLTIQTLEKAGFILNYSKSHLTPSTKIEFLGFVIKTKSFCISLTDSKFKGIQNSIKEILQHNGHTTIRKLSKLISKLVATFPCSDDAKLHYRILDRFKVKMLIQHKYRLSSKICLTKPCLQELMWWRTCTKLTLTRYLHAVEITQHIYTYSSGGAFGGCWNERMIQSKFSELQVGLSINTKELLAIYYTLSAFGGYLQGEHVLVHCDNTVSVSCIKK